MILLRAQIKKWGNTVERKFNVEEITKEMAQLTTLLKAAEKEEANLSGRLHEAMKRLKSEFTLDSVEDAQKQLKLMEQQQEKLKTTIAEKFSALQGEYQWE